MIRASPDRIKKKMRIDILPQQLMRATPLCVSMYSTLLSMCIFRFLFRTWLTRGSGARWRLQHHQWWSLSDAIRSCASYIFIFDILAIRSKGESWLCFLSKAGRPRLSLSKVEALDTTDHWCYGERTAERVGWPYVYAMSRHFPLLYQVSLVTCFHWVFTPNIRTLPSIWASPCQRQFILS